MLGAVIGDIIGSRFEFLTTKERDVELFHPACSFTDDTVCTSAICLATIVSRENMALHQQLQTKYPHEYSVEFDTNNPQFDPVHSTRNHQLYQSQDHTQDIFISKIYAKTLQQICMKYPMAGYGKMFMHWLTSSSQTPYGSLGNGILMRISPIVLLSNSLEEALYLANISGAITHNHPDALLSAQQYIELLWIARTWNKTKEELKLCINEKLIEFHIEVLSVEQYHQQGGYHILAPDTLKRALACVLEANDFEETMRNALYIGSDTDTTAAIAGALAEIIYGINISWLKKINNYFNYQNIEILQHVLCSYHNIYPESSINGKLFTTNCLTIQHRDWYQHTKNLVLEDPTAAWDPLEIDPDSYYSPIDKILQLERDNTFIKFLKWIKIK